MSSDRSIEKEGFLAIGEMAWEIHRIHATLEDLNNRLEWLHKDQTAVIKQLARIGDACVDIAVSVETRP